MTIESGDSPSWNPLSAYPQIRVQLKHGQVYASRPTEHAIAVMALLYV